MKKNVEKILIILNIVLVAIPYSMYFTGIDMQSLHFIWAWIITFILGIIVEVFSKNEKFKKIYPLTAMLIGMPFVIVFLSSIYRQLVIFDGSTIAIILIHYMCAASGRSVVECCKTIFEHITKKKNGE
jgi:hypothetical protein